MFNYFLLLQQEAIPMKRNQIIARWPHANIWDLLFRFNGSSKKLTAQFFRNLILKPLQSIPS